MTKVGAQKFVFQLNTSKIDHSIFHFKICMNILFTHESKMGEVGPLIKMGTKQATIGQKK